MTSDSRTACVPVTVYEPVNQSIAKLAYTSTLSLAYRLLSRKVITIVKDKRWGKPYDLPSNFIQDVDVITVASRLFHVTGTTAEKKTTLNCHRLILNKFKPTEIKPLSLLQAIYFSLSFKC